MKSGCTWLAAAFGPDLVAVSQLLVWAVNTVHIAQYVDPKALPYGLNVEAEATSFSVRLWGMGMVCHL